MHRFATKFILFVACVSCLRGRASASNTDSSNPDISVVDNFASGLKVVYRAYQQCEDLKLGELFSCLKLKAIRMADRALQSDSIQLIDGLSFVKGIPEAGDRSGRKFNFEPLPEVNEAVLPKDTEQRDEKLNELLADRITRFFQSHSVQVDMPRTSGDASVEEGRRRRNKFGLLMLGGLLKGGMLAMGMKGLALLAGKALLVAKIALVLALVSSVGNIMGGGHSQGKTTYEIVSHPHVSYGHEHSSSFEGGHGQYEDSGHGHFRRSVNEMYPYALAYRGQNPVIAQS